MSFVRDERNHTDEKLQMICCMFAVHSSAADPGQSASHGPGCERGRAAAPAVRGGRVPGAHHRVVPRRREDRAGRGAAHALPAERPHAADRRRQGASRTSLSVTPLQPGC